MPHVYTVWICFCYRSFLTLCLACIALSCLVDVAILIHVFLCCVPTCDTPQQRGEHLGQDVSVLPALIPMMPSRLYIIIKSLADVRGGAAGGWETGEGEDGDRKRNKQEGARCYSGIERRRASASTSLSCR